MPALSLPCPCPVLLASRTRAPPPSGMTHMRTCNCAATRGTAHNCNCADGPSRVTAARWARDGRPQAIACAPGPVGSKEGQGSAAQRRATVLHGAVGGAVHGLSGCPRGQSPRPCGQRDQTAGCVRTCCHRGGRALQAKRRVSTHKRRVSAPVVSRWDGARPATSSCKRWSRTPIHSSSALRAPAGPACTALLPPCCTVGHSATPAAHAPM